MNNISVIKLEGEGIGSARTFLKQHGANFFQIDPVVTWAGVMEHLENQIFQYAKSKSVHVARNQEGEIVGLIGFQKKQWDEEHFGYPVAAIDYLYATKGSEGRAAADQLLHVFDSWAAAEGIKRASVRYMQQEEIASALLAHSFYFIENDSYLARDLTKNPPKENTVPSGITIRLYMPGEEEKIYEIVRRAPWTNRFHSDKTIEKTRADELYVKWVRGGISNASKRITVLECEGRLAGFMLWSYERIVSGGDSFLLGDQELVAIDPDFSGRGFARHLYNGCLVHMSKLGVSRAWTVVNSQNTPALKTLKNLGFSSVYTADVYHRQF